MNDESEVCAGAFVSEGAVIKDFTGSIKSRFYALITEPLVLSIIV